MQMMKMILLLLLFSASSFVGILFSNKYKARVKELKELKNGLNMFKTKIRFTYEPIPELFREIAPSLTKSIGDIFESASDKMKSKTAGQAWVEAIEESNTNLTKEDISIAKGLNKLLGKTDIDGQVSQIELTNNFLDTQIEKAEKERVKNEKLYKTLGTVVGLAMVIILI